MASILIRFFSGCPDLEAITLADNIDPSPHKYHHRYYQINTSMLKTIAEKCRRLRYLHVYDVPNDYWDKIHYTGADFLCFANTDNNSHHNNNDQHGNMLLQLERLTVPQMDSKTALTLVTKIDSLKYLSIGHWYHLHSPTEKKTVLMYEWMEPVKKVLEDRGGSLRVEPSHP
ncbi:hypothetical protein BDA99DRAFT_508950 [Phascolomyces articulosus]|uniref:Uncharacterized protein n=1 Tax=Phascolomyces articulosus TaxID=60185 RepID=A0AAD5K1I2_9FUNG|nr:hypothetical protein BDA99DRAFT_508950 [Phascolomyces articulosus]